MKQVRKFYKWSALGGRWAACGKMCTPVEEGQTRFPIEVSDKRSEPFEKKRGNAEAFPLRTWAFLLTASELASQNSGYHNVFLLMILGQ